MKKNVLLLLLSIFGVSLQAMDSATKETSDPASELAELCEEHNLKNMSLEELRKLAEENGVDIDTVQLGSGKTLSELLEEGIEPIGFIMLPNPTEENSEKN